MKTKNKNWLIPLIVMGLVLILNGCNKKEEKTSPSTPKEILTSKSWKITSTKVNGVEVLQDCEKDDVLTFLANGTYTYNVGTNKCNTSDTNYTGTWTLSDDGKTIVFDGDNGTAVITESQVVATYVSEGSTHVVTLIPA
jgi:heat shock protein HslJ